MNSSRPSTHQALLLQFIITVLAPLIAFTQPTTHAISADFGVDQERQQVKILGVSPKFIQPGGKVYILLSAPVLPSDGKSRLSVSIDGRSAEIVELAQDAITVSAPEKLNLNVPLTVSVIGMGLNLETGPEQEVFAEIGRSRILPGIDVLALLGFGTLILSTIVVFVRRNRRRERDLLKQRERELDLHKQQLERDLLKQRERELDLHKQLENLQFRLERQQASPPPGEPPVLRDGELLGRDTVGPSRLPSVPDGLIDAINRGECTFFWGGGLSAQAGYPTWREALSDMVERNVRILQEPLAAELGNSLRAGQYSLVIEVLLTRLGRDTVMQELVRLWGALRSTTSASAIDALAKLRFANVVTSVWDPLIDQAFAHRGPTVVTGVSSESLETLLSREAFYIVRLWGALTRPDSVLFTENEYRGAVAGNPIYAKYLASLALSQSHLFIGASIETIEEYLAATPQSQKSRTHYALVPETDRINLSREVFRTRYGVELLVFQPTPGWPELAGFVKELAHAVAERAPVTVPTIEAFQLFSINLENIGPFKRLSLDLDPSWTVLLGNNGSGKSTVLRAIALVLCGDDSRAFMEGSRLLQTGARSGSIELRVGRDVYRTDLTRDRSGTVHVNPGTRVSPLKTGRWVALAFPPLRGISTENPKGPTPHGSHVPTVEDVLPILAGQVDARLSSLKQWLVNLDVRAAPGAGVTAEDAAESRRLRDHFFKVFNAFVPGVNVKFASVDRTSWLVKVTTNGVEVGIDQVSQGTSSLLGWVGALLQRMYEIHGAGKDIKDEGAVVLIDEIDAHLHPEWQQRIVAALKKEFPHVQFIATTHSPLIVGELEPSQVYRFRKDGEELVADHPMQPIKGMGVAGLLTSEMFGLTSTVDNETQLLLEKQRMLSASTEPLSNDQKTELEEVNRQLEDLGFRYQVRDPEFTEYLKQRYRGTQTLESSQGAARGPVNPRVKELMKTAITRATGGTIGGDK